MSDEKLKEVYYQLDHLWTGGKAIRELPKISSIPEKEDVKSWLEKQTLWHFHKRSHKELKHLNIRWQNLMSSIRLICVVYTSQCLRRKRIPVHIGRC